MNSNITKLIIDNLKRHSLRKLKQSTLSKELLERIVRDYIYSLRIYKYKSEPKEYLKHKITAMGITENYLITISEPFGSIVRVKNLEITKFQCADWDKLECLSRDRFVAYRDDRIKLISCKRPEDPHHIIDPQIGYVKELAGNRLAYSTGLFVKIVDMSTFATKVKLKTTHLVSYMYQLESKEFICIGGETIRVWDYTKLKKELHRNCNLNTVVEVRKCIIIPVSIRKLRVWDKQFRYLNDISVPGEIKAFKSLTNGKIALQTITYVRIIDPGDMSIHHDIQSKFDVEMHPLSCNRIVVFTDAYTSEIWDCDGDVPQLDNKNTSKSNTYCLQELKDGKILVKHYSTIMVMERLHGNN
jgi:hypothetical protein